MRVRVIDGPDRGAVVLDANGEITIGTADGNTLVLGDPTVSRYHVLITATPEGVHLRDVGSTNGVFLGEHRVESAWIDAGAALKLGLSTLRFEYGEDDVEEPLSTEDSFGRAIGRSIAMRRVFEALPRIAASDATVLIQGETGTGKTLLAEAIHQAGPRKPAPFVVIDCGAIPPTLIESELF